jgi:hypothetical protein
VIDGKPNKRAFARYANDARGLTRIKGLLNNADYVVDGLKAYIEAKKDIPAGGEILVDYGKDYWKIIRENIKLWSKEKNEKQKLNGTSNRKINGTTRKVKTTAKRMEHAH